MSIPRTDPIAMTSAGPVRGRWADGVADFRGIPYGRAERFRAPVEPEPWSDVRAAQTTGPRAVQKFGNLFQTRTGDYYTGARIGELGLNDQRDSEDCLIANVLTPEPSGARPVMVYMHGGGFAEGSGVLATAAHRFVAEEDVVLVSVNHRLNVFGYLHLAELDDRFPDAGNAGLLDLVLALQWVRANAPAFGGDPANVTIFGESGGGGKVSCLLAMPAAQGLFERAVVQSGSILRAIESDEATRRTHRLLDRTGLDVDGLQSLAAADLFALIETDAYQYRPVVDGRHLPRHPFEPDAPPTAHGIPLVVGHCADEMNWLWADDEPLFSLDETQLLPHLCQRLGLDETAAKHAIAVYRTERPEATASEVFLRAAGDGLFGHPATAQAERQARTGAAVFRYLFAYETPLENGKYRAFHTAELPLIFRLVQYAEMDGLSRRLASAWAAFARSGDPSTAESAWPCYDLSRRHTMIFDVNPHVEDDPAPDVRRLWERLPRPELFATAVATDRTEGDA